MSQEQGQIVGDEHTYLSEELAKNVAFVMVTIHRWHGQHKIKSASVILDPEKNDTALSEDIITKPRWNLLPEAWRKKLAVVEGKFRSAIFKASIVNPDNEEDAAIQEVSKFPIRGVHIIPRKNMHKFFEEIRSIETEQFQPLIKELGEAWPDIVKNLQDSMKGQPDGTWNEISRHLPTTADSVMKRFWVEKILVPITFSKAGIDQLAGDAVDTYMDEIKDYGKKFTSQITQTIMSGLEDELKNSVDNLVNRIEDGGVIKEATINMVRNSFEKLRSFDFLMTDDLKKKILEVEQKLSQGGVKFFNEELKEHGPQSVTAGLAEALKSVRSQCIADYASYITHGRARKTIKT